MLHDGYFSAELFSVAELGHQVQNFTSLGSWEVLGGAFIAYPLAGCALFEPHPSLEAPAISNYFPSGPFVRHG
jgi:hypothetical protein